MKWFVIKVMCFSIFMAGTMSGLCSLNSHCGDQYLDLRKPVHYIIFPHTIGYYLGRVVGFPYGDERKYKNNCHNVFNHTLEGPIRRF